MNSFSRTIAVLAVSQVSIYANSQGFNVDFDSNGLPSFAFGAAANQPGFWNYGSYDRPLLGLDGNRSNVRMRIEGNSGGSGSNYNPANTGDFERLLNDGAHVGSLFQGGRMHITITGLEPGKYHIFTYAVLPSGGSTYAPVYVPQAANDHVQVVTGPMPGNAFEHLITHSIHEVLIPVGGPLEIIVDRAPQSPSVVFNGFQLLPVELSCGQVGAKPREPMSLESVLAYGAQPR